MQHPALEKDWHSCTRAGQGLTGCRAMLLKKTWDSWGAGDVHEQQQIQQNIGLYEQSSLRQRVIPAQSALIWLYLDAASSCGFPHKREVLKPWDVFKRWQPWWWELEHLTQETREFGLFSLGDQQQCAVSERMALGRGSQRKGWREEPRNHRQTSQAMVILVFPSIHFLWHTVRVFKSNPLSFVLLSLPKLLTLP